MRNIGSAPAVKVEITVTAANGEKVTWEFDQFQEFYIDTMHEPEYVEWNLERVNHTGPRISQMVFTVNKPGQYRVWVPKAAEQPAIDDGNVVEEGN